MPPSIASTARRTSSSPTCPWTRAEHSLGGIPSWEAAETTDENPERVAVLARLTTVYLRATLTGDDAAWERARRVFAEVSTAIGRIDR